MQYPSRKSIENPIKMCDEYYKQFTAADQHQENNFIPMFFKTIKSSSYSLFNYTKNKYSSYLSRTKTYPFANTEIHKNRLNVPTSTTFPFYQDTVYQYVQSSSPVSSLCIPFESLYIHPVSSQDDTNNKLQQPLNNYHSVNKQPRLKRCGIICIRNIFNVPHVLIVRGKRSHIWSLPKGCINQNETEIECAQRETMEETGLNINITSSCPRVAINHNVYFVVMIDFNPKLKTRDVHEIDKVSWMTLQEIQELQCNKDLRSILQYPKRKFSFHNALIEPLQLDKFVSKSCSVQHNDQAVNEPIKNIIDVGEQSEKESIPIELYDQLYDVDDEE